jgi:hypothetical protein
MTIDDEDSCPFDKTGCSEVSLILAYGQNYYYHTSNLQMLYVLHGKRINHVTRIFRRRGEERSHGN